MAGLLVFRTFTEEMLHARKKIDSELGTLFASNKAYASNCTKLSKVGWTVVPYSGEMKLRKGQGGIMTVSSFIGIELTKNSLPGQQ